jgi:hypothetical protein
MANKYRRFRISQSAFGDSAGAANAAARSEGMRVAAEKRILYWFLVEVSCLILLVWDEVDILVVLISGFRVWKTSSYIQYFVTKI